MSDEIAHYTTEQGLAGILSSKKLWATHWRFLNDLSETQQGMDIINDIHLTGLPRCARLIQCNLILL